MAEGFVAIAVGNMANAIKKISVQRGYDVTEYTLATFGGAGGQHACQVADALGMTRVFIHPLAGVLSAYGMGLADITAMREQSTELVLEDANVAELAAVLERLAATALGEVLAQGVPAERIRVARRVHLRYDGTDSALVVDFAGSEAMTRAFEAAYRTRYSFLMPGRRLIAEAVSVEAIGAADAPDETPPARAPRAGAPAPAEVVAMFAGGARHRHAGVPPRRACARATGSTARRSSPKRTRRPSSTRAGGRRSRRSTISCSSAPPRAPAAPRSAPASIR